MNQQEAIPALAEWAFSDEEGELTRFEYRAARQMYFELLSANVAAIETNSNSTWPLESIVARATKLAHATIQALVAGAESNK